MGNHLNGANLGFENALWRAADAMRSNMDAAEYKHVVLGLIFLKCISDAFEEHHAKLEADRPKGADPEGLRFCLRPRRSAMLKAALGTRRPPAAGLEALP